MRIALIILVLISGTFHFSQDCSAQSPLSQGDRGYRAGVDAVPYCGPCKTGEEVAWDLMIYGLQNIPAMKAKIKDYDDLLDAYRGALRAVRGREK